MTKLNEGRILAYDALISSQNGESLEIVLGNGMCSQKDKRLAWHISFGVLRHRGQLNEILIKHVKGKWSKVKIEVQVCLQIGLFECLFCRTPNRAAISQAVELVKGTKQKYASGLVNAVLRKGQNEQLPSPILNVPEWMRPYFKGKEDWLVEKPPVHIVSKNFKRPNIEDISEIHPDFDGVYRVNDSTENISDWPGYEEGEWWIMDPAAVRVVDMAWRALGEPECFTALDACAAPGGKSWRLHSRKAIVTATDVSQKRIDLMNESAERLGMPVETMIHDWSNINTELPLFDIVLVDAPCSGSGVIRRHPEIRWRRSPTDVKANSILQFRILSNAAKHVNPNGLLVYSVCSIFPHEGIQVVEKLKNWRVVEHVTTFPSSINEDGFQIFILKNEDRCDA